MIAPVRDVPSRHILPVEEKRILPDPFRFSVFQTQTEVGHRDATRGAIDDGVAATLRRDAHEEKQVLVSQFRQRLDVRPEGTDFDAALQLEPMDNDVSMPFAPLMMIECANQLGKNGIVSLFSYLLMVQDPRLEITWPT